MPRHLTVSIALRLRCNRAGISPARAKGKKHFPPNLRPDWIDLKASLRMGVGGVPGSNSNRVMLLYRVERPAAPQANVDLFAKHKQAIDDLELPGLDELLYTADPADFR